MYEPLQIVETTSRPAAVIRLTTPRSAIAQVMAPAITELLEGLVAQDIAPAGPLFSRHLQTDANTFDFELGVPIDAPLAAAGRIRAGELPGSRAARTIYHGRYEGLYDAWKAFNDRIAAEGHRPAPGPWECYITGPESNPDPAQWCTELNRPLLD